MNRNFISKSWSYLKKHKKLFFVYVFLSISFSIISSIISYISAKIIVNSNSNSSIVFYAFVVSILQLFTNILKYLADKLFSQIVDLIIFEQKTKYKYYKKLNKAKVNKAFNKTLTILLPICSIGVFLFVINIYIGLLFVVMVLISLLFRWFFKEKINYKYSVN